MTLTYMTYMTLPLCLILNPSTLSGQAPILPHSIQSLSTGYAIALMTKNLHCMLTFSFSSINEDLYMNEKGLVWQKGSHRKRADPNQQLTSLGNSITCRTVLSSRQRSWLCPTANTASYDLKMHGELTATAGCAILRMRRSEVCVGGGGVVHSYVVCVCDVLIICSVRCFPWQDVVFSPCRISIIMPMP